MKPSPQVLFMVATLLISLTLGDESDSLADPRRRLHRSLSSDLILGSLYPSLYERVGDELVPLRDSLNVKIKKSLYRLNRPITSRQTRLASFGSMLVPKIQSGNSRPTMRYGK